MNTSYTLHFAPDNASLIVRIALEMLNVPFTTQLVDRSVNAQSAPAYRALNPLGMIPALETDEGVIFETGAILLWLADKHGALFPAVADKERGDALKWVFFMSNSLHAGLRQMFYPEKFIAPEFSVPFRDATAQRICTDFKQVDDLIADPACSCLGGPQFSILDIYACVCLRWAQLYPNDYKAGWLQADDFPSLQALAARLETHPATVKSQTAEGLGPTPFTAPIHAKPPQGSAT